MANNFQHYLREKHKSSSYAITLVVIEIPIQLDSIDVDIQCPNCGAANKVTLAQIKREESINCIGCGTVLHLKDKDGSVKRGTQKVQNALDDLDRTLRRFGRR